MNRICVVRCHYYRDTRVQREVDALLDAGHSVHVVCLRDGGEPLRQRRDRLTVIRIPLPHRPGAGTARRFAEYALFFAVSAMVLTLLHVRRRFDVVQVNSVPDALVFVALVPRLTGARVLLDLQEPLPEFFAARTGKPADHGLVRLVGAIEQRSIRFAHAVVTVTEPMRQAFIERGATPDKITVVMDGSDQRTFTRKKPVRRARERDRFVLVSHGTIEPHYGLDTAIRAVAKLVPELPSVELRIIGDGSQRSDLIALADELGVADRVYFSPGFVPIDELIAELSEADVGVVAMKRNPFRDLTLAGKMFDFINMGIPMAVSRTRSVQTTFPPGCFEQFTADDPDDLARAVLRLHDNPALAAGYVARAREAARPYSWPAQRAHYGRVVHELLDTTRVAEPLVTVRAPIPAVSGFRTCD
ncbi:glycosyltransferase family 4 protein [Mycolicibacterium phlei]